MKGNDKTDTGLSITPLRIKDANRLVAQFHRHHRPTRGGLFAIGVMDGTELVGAVIVGRPVARGSDDGFTAEVTRCVVKEGHQNAASKLYAAARRAAGALGYTKVQTYTLPQESGSSLLGAGWELAAVTRPRSWGNRAGRSERHAYQEKLRWEVTA